MRWRRREGPWGSHQDDARLLKWEISSGLTEEKVDEGRRVGDAGEGGKAHGDGVARCRSAKMDRGADALGS